MNYSERKFNMDIAAVSGLREAVIADITTDSHRSADTACWKYQEGKKKQRKQKSEGLLDQLRPKRRDW